MKSIYIFKFIFIYFFNFSSFKDRKIRYNNSLIKTKPKLNLCENNIYKFYSQNIRRVFRSCVSVAARGFLRIYTNMALWSKVGDGGGLLLDGTHWYHCPRCLAPPGTNSSPFGYPSLQSLNTNAHNLLLLCLHLFDRRSSSLEKPYIDHSPV